jgi:uncharacterized membrane protein YidH (DUF202 family)
MRIGAGLALIAIGAILRFAIATSNTHGVAVHTIGDILMLVGVLGLVLVVAVWAPWARSRRAVYRTEVPPERAVYRTEVPVDEVPPTRDYPYEDEFRR